MNHTAQRVTVAVSAVAVLLVALVLGNHPAGADASLDPSAVAEVQRANCALLAAHTSGAQRTRALQCVTDQVAIITLRNPATPTATATASPTTTVLPTPTAPGTTTPPATTPPAATTPPTTTPPAAGWPSQATTGVPAGWGPSVIRSGGWTITTPGVYSDVRVTGDVDVRVAGVTLRRVEVIDGSINNDGPGCAGAGLTLDQVTVRTGNGQPGGSTEGAVGPGGYTATRVAILDTVEGFRVGDKSVCGPVSITDSYARVKDGGNCNLHADGLQGYDGGPVTVRHTTLYFAASCGTAAFFVPSGQGNTSATIDGLFVWGPGVGYTFRLGVPATVRGLLIGSRWVYGPIDVKCSVVSVWDASIVTVGADGQPAATLRAQPCNTEAGS